MRYGHKRDAQLAAWCDYSAWICLAARMHPDDIRLVAFSRIVNMSTVQELVADKNAMDARETDILRDRIADCEECRGEGQAICYDNGRYTGKCRWRASKSKVEFVRGRFGDDAIQFLKKYTDVKAKGEKKS